MVMSSILSKNLTSVISRVSSSSDEEEEVVGGVLSREEPLDDVMETVDEDPCELPLLIGVDVLVLLILGGCLCGVGGCCGAFNC